MYLNKTIVLCFLLIFPLAHAQEESDEGDAHFFSYSFRDAIFSYENAIAQGDSLTTKQYLNLAESYFRLDNFEKASALYTDLYARDSVLDKAHFNRFLIGLRETVSRERMRFFLNEERPFPQKELYANSDFNYQLLSIPQIVEDGTAFKVFNLEGNSPQSDLGPTFYGDDLLFSSGRPSSSRNSYKSMGEAYLDIFEGKIDEYAQLSKVKKFKGVVDSDYHKTTPYYAAELNSLFFVLSNTLKGQLKFDENGKNSLAIGVQKIGGEFSFLWRDLSTSFYYPFYDSATSKLYFSADFGKGYGGTDLYYVNTNKGQIMSAPINLGPTINSPGNEIAPYIFEGALYFSSDVFYGLGGMDVYKANIKDGSYSIPINLGEPINSKEDDFGFIIKNYEEGLLGYFSSNREGGKGMDDLYGFRVDEKPGLKTFAVNGTVTNITDNLGIAAVTLNVYGEGGKLLATTTSDEKGQYGLEVPWQSEVRLEASKERCSTFSKTYDQEQMETVQAAPLNVPMAVYKDLVAEQEGQVAVKMDKFYFARSTADVTPDIAKELDKVVAFVKHFPRAQLRVETHTDSRGGSATNFRLTQSRSDAIKKYLIDQGVPASNILFSVGYGEDRILNNCKNGVYCIELLHKQNQRSLVVVLNDNLLFNQ